MAKPGDTQIIQRLWAELSQRMGGCEMRVPCWEREARNDDEDSTRQHPAAGADLSLFDRWDGLCGIYLADGQAVSWADRRAPAGSAVYRTHRTGGARCPPAVARHACRGVTAILGRTKGSNQWAEQHLGHRGENSTSGIGYTFGMGKGRFQRSWAGSGRWSRYFVCRLMPASCASMAIQIAVSGFSIATKSRPAKRNGWVSWHIDRDGSPST